MEKRYYIGIDKCFRNGQGTCGYNRLEIFKLSDYHSAKVFFNETINNIFENEFPVIIKDYSEKELNINYPIIISNDPKLYFLYKNVLNEQEFEIYCKGDKLKRFFIDNNKLFPDANKYKPIAFKNFELGSNGEIVFEKFKELLSNDKLGFKNFDPNTIELDSSNGNSYESYNPDLIEYYEFF